jgi:3-hydroxyacyl-CoA dehydrogenase
MASTERNVAIVGAGLIGRAWATIFARAGWNVRLSDPHIPTLKAAPRLIRDELHALARHGLASDPDAAIAKVSIAASLQEALLDVEFVQENGPEVVEDKKAIFGQLDKLAPPNALLVSSTSAITASRFTESLPGRARCLVGHPVNPPHLIPLVELCGAPWTSPDAIDRARNIYREIGQVPVTINKEINGFVLNRLQGALLAEAFRLVGEGYISAEDLDHTVKDGLGLRWSFLGPFETIELNAPGGIPDYCARYTGFYKELAATAAGPEVYQSPVVDRVIAAWPHQPTPERIAALTQRRNERLAALAAHKAAQTSFRGDAAATNPDVHSHIKESRDSGSGPSDHPGMTN